MPTEKLKKAISEIAKAVGADENKANALSSDIKGLKAQISRMTDEDLDRLIKSVGKENAERIMKDLNRK